MCYSKHSLSIDLKIIWQGSLDKGAHQAHLEFVEGNFARIVAVEPAEHLLEELLFLLVVKFLTEGSDERFAHRSDLVYIEPPVTIFIGFFERFPDKHGKLISLLFKFLLFFLRSLVYKFIEFERLLMVDTHELDW